jgi:6-phosphofructokinase 2
MNEQRIVTATLNPTVDVACDADTVRTIHKVRTYLGVHHPGGGGVNVARVVQELGGSALAVGPGAL